MLYKVTVRSVLDFALPVYYHTLKVCEKQRLEQIQYKCAKLTCGALHFTSQIKLNNELGLETIATRADFLSLNTFHKILVGRTRPLVRSCMPIPTPFNEHNTRHRKLFLPYKSNSMKFTNSFFLKMAKKYENLPRSCRSKADPDLFKDELRSHLVPLRYKFLSRGSKLGGKFLTQIRVGRSLLNSHGYTVGKSLSPQCPCHFPQESPSHYFLDCFLYTEERRSLFGIFEHFIPNFTSFNKKKKLETI